ncbi:MAG: hypothetical protein ISS19_10605 [Bacteroidales bacterium]|nr:hypothetical protein [Bacteroidales bacterium]
MGAADGEELLGRILAFTGGHPYYTQLFAQQAALLQGLNKSKPVSFDQLLEESLILENDYLEKMWDSSRPPPPPQP